MVGVGTDPTIHITQGGQYIKLVDVRLSTLAAQSAAIGFDSGINCTLEHFGLSFDRTAAYGRTNIILGSASVVRSGPSEVSYIQTLFGSGAIDPNYTQCDLNLLGGDALTLADGLYDNQELLIVVLSHGGGASTLTPANLTVFPTITFNSAGDSVNLRWNATSGSWMITGIVNATAP